MLFLFFFWEIYSLFTMSMMETQSLIIGLRFGFIGVIHLRGQEITLHLLHQIDIEIIEFIGNSMNLLKSFKKTKFKTGFRINCMNFLSFSWNLPVFIVSRGNSTQIQFEEFLI